MASLAVSEDGTPFGVGEDLLKSRRRKIVQPQEVRGQFRRCGFYFSFFCLFCCLWDGAGGCLLAWLAFSPLQKYTYVYRLP